MVSPRHGGSRAHAVRSAAEFGLLSDPGGMVVEIQAVRLGAIECANSAPTPSGRGLSPRRDAGLQRLPDAEQAGARRVRMEIECPSARARNRDR